MRKQVINFLPEIGDMYYNELRQCVIGERNKKGIGRDG